MRSKIIIPAIIATVVTAGGVFAVSKADFSPRQESIIQKLTERFNLSETEVEEVFKKHKEEHRGRMGEHKDRFGHGKGFELKLARAVENGTITGEQKEMLIQKKAELHKENCEGLALEQRNEMKEKHQAELEQFARNNGIDVSILEKGLGHGKKAGQ